MSAAGPHSSLDAPGERAWGGLDDAGALAPFRALVAERLGLALPAPFDRPLARALTQAGAASGRDEPAALLAILAGADCGTPAWQALIAGITVRETTFFRQMGWWDGILRHALLPLIARRRAEGHRHLRYLSIGCASGEEPYSLAMMLDRLLRAEPGWSVEIGGLDLCEAALAEAAAGVYDPRALREVPAAERERWFRALPGRRFVLADELRARVRLRPFNLFEAARAGLAAPGAPADLVICRNVIIHMQPAHQTGIARYLARQVARGGFLAVAPVEATPGWFAPLRFHATPQTILFERPLEARPPGGGLRAVPRPTGEATAPALLAAATPISPPPRPPHPARRPEAAPAGPLGQARRLADRGLFEEARRLCERMLDDGEESHLLMALVCQALGDLPGAQAAAQRARRAAPLSPAAHYVAAIVGLRAGRAREARAALGEAVRLLEAAGGRGERLGIGPEEIRQAARRVGLPVRGAV